MEQKVRVIGLTGADTQGLVRAGRAWELVPETGQGRRGEPKEHGLPSKAQKAEGPSWPS